MDRPLTQLSLAGVRVDFGATRLLDDVSFTVTRGERWGIIGRNGAGKTTLFRLITGELQPSSGIVARASGLRISLMDQQREFADAATVWEAATTTAAFDPRPWEELAKFHEHRARDLSTARAVVIRALDLAAATIDRHGRSSSNPAAARVVEAFAHRLARLERRLAT